MSLVLPVVNGDVHEIRLQSQLVYIVHHIFVMMMMTLEFDRVDATGSSNADIAANVEHFRKTKSVVICCITLKRKKKTTFQPIRQQVNELMTGRLIICTRRRID